jgi:hypothetical protein
MNFQLPILSAGRGEPGTNRVCAEQAVNWLVSGRLDLGDETDHPECVQPVLNALAIHVNDTVSDKDRKRMWPIILRQPGTAHPEMEPVLSVRLACYLADQVFDLVRPEDQAVCREAIDAARAWCDDPSDKNLQQSLAAAHAAASTTYAVYGAKFANAANAAANAAYAAANANAASDAAAYAAYAARFAGRDPIALLEGAQAECERLTGHTPTEMDPERIKRLAEMVGAR